MFQRKIVTSLFALFLLTLLPSSASAQDDCNILFQADDKLLSTDHRGFATHSTPTGQTETTESVMVAGVTYIKVKGIWRKSPITVAELRAQKDENRKSAKAISCKYLRDESVSGEAARVFSGHYESDDDKSDVTTWISKSHGLPLRQEQDIDTGGGPAGKMHYSVRYEYTNVPAPPVQ